MSESIEQEYLNGISGNSNLPNINVGDQNKSLVVNSTATDYTLSLLNQVPNPSVVNCLLQTNSTSSYVWNSIPTCASINVYMGATSTNGYKFSNGLNSGIDFASNTLNLRNNGTAVKTLSTTLITNNLPMLMSGNNSFSTTTGNITSGGNIQTTIGSTSSNGINFGQFQNGIYSESLGNINIYANAGTSSFQFNNVIHTCQRRLLLNMALCFTNAIYTLGGVYTINYFSNPLFVGINHASTGLDFEFTLPSDYQNSQMFIIVTHNLNSNPTNIRYRAQGQTYLFDSTGSFTLIATNTYYTLPNNHIFLLFANLNSSFYLFNLI